MRLLAVHSHPLDTPGGAELSLRHHFDNAPPGVEIDVILPDDPVRPGQYDVVLLCNLRPPGGLGLEQELRWAVEWSCKLHDYGGYAVKLESDVNPCTYRDGRCYRYDSDEQQPCDCDPQIPRAFERLCNLCDALIFVSPLQQRVVRNIIDIRAVEQHLVAPPIDFGRFRITTPFGERRRAALVTGDRNRVSPEAFSLAEKAGYPVEQVEYLSVAYDRMPALLNRYQAVVIAPAILHACPRLAVEAMACGCEVIMNSRVGVTSWNDPIAACGESNDRFWTVLTNPPDHANPLRFAADSLTGHR